MVFMEKIYDREKYINEYKLNIDEIALLPIDIRLAYMDKIYRSSVEKAKTTKEEEQFRGYLHPIYNPYFEKCGCQATNYDFGVEQYGVKSVRESDFTVDPKYVDAALDYTKKVAQIRSVAYETTYEYLLDETRKSIKLGILESHPNFKALENILNSPLSYESISYETSVDLAKEEISALDIEPGESVSMSVWLPKIYRDALIQEGYQITEENEEELKVRRLK